MTESPIFVDKQMGERRIFRTHRSLVQQSMKSGQETEEATSDVPSVNESELITVFETVGNETSQESIDKVI